MSTDAVFAALADPTRRSILVHLRAHATLTAGEIAARFPSLSRPAVSKHLGILRRAELVRARERGREHHYALDARPLRALQLEWLDQFAPMWEQSLQQLRQQVEADRKPPR